MLQLRIQAVIEGSPSFSVLEFHFLLLLVKHDFYGVLSFVCFKSHCLPGKVGFCLFLDLYIM